MKYSIPKQRIAIYRRMIRDIDNGEYFYMCRWIMKKNDFLSALIIQDAFPELMSLRPPSKSITVAWYPLTFKGMQMRRKKLLKAIEKAKTKNYKR